MSAMSENTKQSLVSLFLSQKGTVRKETVKEKEAKVQNEKSLVGTKRVEGKITFNIWEQQ